MSSNYDEHVGIAADVLLDESHDGFFVATIDEIDGEFDFEFASSIARDEIDDEARVRFEMLTAHILALCEETGSSPNTIAAAVVQEIERSRSRPKHTVERVR